MFECSDIGQIDEQIGRFTQLMYDTCFSVCSKMVMVGRPNPPGKSKRAPWFNAECKAAKDEFLKAKRPFKFSANDRDKVFYYYYH